MAAILLQIGHCFARLGFCSDPVPRICHPIKSLFESNETTPAPSEGEGKTPSLIAAPKQLTRAEWRNCLRHDIVSLFMMFTEAVTDDGHLVLVENETLPRAFREALRDILFRRMKFACIHAVSNQITPLYAQGLHTGLLIDVGYRETRILPIAFGTPMIECMKVVCLGVQNCLEEFKAAIESGSEIRQVPEEAWDLIMFKLGHVRVEHYNKLMAKESPDDATLSLWLPESRTEIKGKGLGDIRWKIFECLFKGSTKPGLGSGLPSLAAQSIASLPADLKNSVIQNVVVVGGVGDIPGFGERLILEIRQQLKAHPGLRKLRIDLLQLGALPFKSSAAQWIGAHILSTMVDDIPGVTKSEWTVRTDMLWDLERSGLTPEEYKESNFVNAENDVRRMIIPG